MLGLALAGGGTKCAAHLGVLKVFRRHGIEFDIVAGASAGALVAVLYAMGKDLAEVEEALSTLRRGRVLGWTLGRHGLAHASRFQRFLRELTGGARLEGLSTRVLIPAADLLTGTLHLFVEGDAAEAIYASCALPGLLPPMPLRSELLVDGSAVAPLPVPLLKQHGAEVCVGVYFPPGRVTAPASAVHTALRSVNILLHQLATVAGSEADLLLTPHVDHVSFLDFQHMGECIRAGERAAEAALPALLQLAGRAGAMVVPRPGDWLPDQPVMT